MAGLWIHPWRVQAWRPEFEPLESRRLLDGGGASPLSGHADLPLGNAVSVLPDGDVVVTAGFDAEAGRSRLFVARYGPDGALRWSQRTQVRLAYHRSDVAAAADGTICITGVTSGSPDFDPGEAEQRVPGRGSYGFVLKLDGDGDFLWVNALRGARFPTLAASEDGSVSVTGSFRKSLTLDAGNGGSLTLNSNGGLDGFLVHYDADGALAWRRAVGGRGRDQGSAIATGPDGRIVMAGSFTGSLAFDDAPGPALLASGRRDAWLASFDSANNTQWAVALGGLGTEYALGLVCDSQGNSTISGLFSRSIDSDPGPGVQLLSPYRHNRSLFLANLDPAGDWRWSGAIVGGGHFLAVAPLAAAPDGSLYLPLSFNRTFDFDPTPGERMLSSLGKPADAVVVRLSATGQLDWFAPLRSSHFEIAWDVAVDSTGAAYTLGDFDGPIDLDPGPGVMHLGSESGIFLSHLDQGGSYLAGWAV